MKKVLLTGASGGLGMSLTEKLLQKGYFMYLQGHEHVHSLDDWQVKYPKQVEVIKCDLRLEEDIIKMCERVKDVDVVINNAAIEHTSELEEKTATTMLDIYMINTVAPFLIMKHLIRALVNNHGVIINISSDNTIDKYDMVTLEYDLSKVGLNMLTKEFSREYPDVFVTSLCLGWLDTPMNDFPEDIKKELNFVPLDVVTERVQELILKRSGKEIEVLR